MAPLAKPRRSHRKSRNGCFECKKRHIRCDQGRPECSHCFRAERVCSFPQPPSLPGVPSPSPAVSAPGTNEAGDCASTRSRESDLQSASYSAGSPFSVIHMALLHHAEGHMGEYMGLQGQIRPMIDIAIDSAATAPYLLDQLLALSALHLSTKDTSNSSQYHYQATELQTRALGLFNRAKDANSDSNCMPTFVFASLLGIHVLRETLSNNKADLDTFLTAFIRYARLHRGVRTVINESWGVILESNLKPLLYFRDLGEQVDKQTPGTETEELSGFFKSLDPESASVQSCQTALKYVQWSLDICKLHPDAIDVGAHAVMAWPLIIPVEYFDALHQHQPEALVVFAYYAAVLHRYRQFWVFGDAGSSIVHLVSSSLGNFWQKSLAWPAQVLSET